MAELDKDHQYDVEKVPLPCEPPKKLDLSKIPTEILHTATVEALMGQNEDLLTRLNINLKRISKIELENKRLHEMVGRLESHNAGLLDEQTIWQEKIGQLEDALQKIRNQRQMINTLNEELNVQKASLRRHKRYRFKIKNNVRSYINELKENHNRSVAELNNIQSLVQKKEVEIDHLKDSLKQVVDELKTKEVQFDLDVSSLTEIHEDERADLRNQIDSLNEKVSALEIENRDQIVKNKRLREQNVVFENRSIIAERQIKDADARLSERIEKLESEIDRQSTINKTKTLKIDRLQEALTESNEKINEKDETIETLKEKNEGLDLLYNEALEDFKSEKAKYDNSLILNQRLTKNLEETRKKQIEIERHMDMVNEENIKFKTQTQFHEDAISNLKEQTKQNVKSDEDSKKAEKMISQLERLFHEIQSGYTATKPAKSETYSKPSRDEETNEAGEIL